MIEKVIHPGLEDAQEELSEVFEEMRGQLDKEMKRIAELRKVLEEDPGKSFSRQLEEILMNRYILYCGYGTRVGRSGRGYKCYHGRYCLYSIYSCSHYRFLAVYQDHWVSAVPVSAADSQPNKQVKAQSISKTRCGT